jgi:hypothetical protein
MSASKMDIIPHIMSMSAHKHVHIGPYMMSVGVNQLHQTTSTVYVGAYTYV